MTSFFRGGQRGTAGARVPHVMAAKMPPAGSAGKAV